MTTVKDFGQLAQLGKYSRMSKTVVCPWSVLKEKFGDKLRSLKDADSTAPEGEVIAPEITGGTDFTCSACNWEGETLQEFKVHCSTVEHVTCLRKKAVGKSSGDPDGDSSDSDESDASGDEWDLEIEDTKARRWHRRIIDRVLFWERPNIAEDKVGLAICSTLLPGDTDEEINVAVDRLLDDAEPYWILVLLRSGRFAGAVFNVKTNEVVAHKTIKKYTVRAKAGGAQSAQDATGRKPKSAGSSLRRYGEKRLEEDLLALLQDWAPYAAKGRFFASASPTLRPLLVKAVGDQVRIARLPFMASKVTGDQVECLYEQLRVIHLTVPLKEEEKHGNKGRGGSAVNKKGDKDIKTNKGGATEPSEEEPIFVYNEEEDPLFTDLHAAARDGKTSVVLQLLDTIDPTLQDGKDRLFYYFCTDQNLRDAVRRYCAKNPDKWNWASAKIEPLTEEMEEHKKQKAKDKKKRQKERQKEAKAAEREEAARLEEQKKKEDEERKGKPCSNCGKLSGEKPFHRFDFVYCSTDCVMAHKRTIAADAAMARFNKT